MRKTKIEQRTRHGLRALFGLSFPHVQFLLSTVLVSFGSVAVKGEAFCVKIKESGQHPLENLDHPFLQSQNTA